MHQKILLSEKVAEIIMTSIKNDFYKVGDQMPNEIQLSEELGVSRATLREAIKILISRNVLEVRRGIGTFVSETPGINRLDSGLEYLNLSAQKKEILRLMKLLDGEEIGAFQHLSWNDQNKIKSQINEIEKETHTTTQYVYTLFNIIESISLARHSTFKHRLIVQTHEAIKILLTSIELKEESAMERLIQKLVALLGQDEVMVSFDDFMMQFGFYFQEE
ncbi:FadR/GntR family transcriptional regulator [Fusibacter bizertensis]